MEQPTPPSAAIDVVVPFGGEPAEVEPMLRAVLKLELGPEDALILADNSPEGLLAAFGPGLGPRVAVVAAAGERSSYHARNAGARSGRAPWILFTDADCDPDAGLLAAYRAAIAAAGAGVAVIGGAVRPAGGQSAPAARYAASRGHIAPDLHLGADRPAGVTANLLVRRSAFEQLGGFTEGVRSGADLEFCFRAADAGWAVIGAPAAIVDHRHPETVAGMLAKARRHGAGRRWLQRRYPGAVPRPPLLRPLLRAPAAALLLTLGGRLERARFKLLDMRHSAALLRGYWFGDNAAEPWPGRADPSPGATGGGDGSAEAAGDGSGRDPANPA